MMRMKNGWRKAGLAMAVCLALAACSKKQAPVLTAAPQAPNAPQVVPGSERDFIVNVGDRVFFFVNQTTLTPEGQEVLRRQAAWLQQHPQVSLQVEGHADERGTREYNISLSARRSTAARDFLIAQGIAPNRLSTIAYGKERPVALCDNESCWSQNRRAVSVITSGALPG